MQVHMFVRREEEQRTAEYDVSPINGYTDAHVVGVRMGADSVSIHFDSLAAVLEFARIVESEALMLAIDAPAEVAV